MTNRPPSESGNIMFFILLAIALIGLVTAALRSGGMQGAHIDREQAAITAGQIRQYAGELERAVNFITTKGFSESDLRFAVPPGTGADTDGDYGDYEDNQGAQIFHPDGGGAAYRFPPPQSNDGKTWEFYATTALPAVGTDRADLVAVLPHVTPAVCAEINHMNGYGRVTTLHDTGGMGSCVYAASTRFIGSYEDSSPNTIDATPFTAGQPVRQACVTCAPGTSEESYHVFHVLLSR